MLHSDENKFLLGSDSSLKPLQNKKGQKKFGVLEKKAVLL